MAAQSAAFDAEAHRLKTLVRLKHLEADVCR